MLEKDSVLTGLDVLQKDGFAPLRSLRVGLVANAASVSREFQPVLHLLQRAGIDVRTLFGPEHGYRGEEQDLIQVTDVADAADGPRLRSLYGATPDSLKPTSDDLRGLDAVVIDLPDIGSRYYTFQATMLHCLEAASARGVLTVVLDRPNPLGGAAIEGPTVRPGFESFVGAHPIATRHGMTLGELARLYKAERALSGELRVVRCEGWRREILRGEQLAWVLPSPNMPTLDTAWVYPGQCLLEGTNLSEGRGTTRPFELCGAPWIDAERLSGRLDQQQLPGVYFRPAWFRPTFHKHAGQICGGIQLHVMDRDAFTPVRTGLAVLHALRHESADRFRWRTETYEFVSDKPAIDLLFGSDRERFALERGDAPTEIAKAWEPEEAAFRERRKPHLLY